MERDRAIHRDTRRSITPPRRKGQAGLGLPAGTTLPAYVYQPLHATGAPDTVQHPEQSGGPGRRMARIQADLGGPGPAADPEELRSAHPVGGGILRQLLAGQPLVLHRHPHRRARTIRASSMSSSTPPGGTPIQHHQERLSELPVQLRERLAVRPRSSPACSAARSSSPNGSAPTSAARGVRRFRAELGEHVDLRPGRQSGDHIRQRDASATAASGTSTKGITDWAASLGLNYTLQNNLSLYATGARGYKMPALDEFLNATAEQQVDLFDSQEVQSVEGGVKGVVGPLRLYRQRVLDQAEERGEPGTGDRLRSLGHRRGSS